MYETAEVRWFGPGAVPAAVRAWFERGGHPPAPEAERRDHYLLTGTGSLGVKLRQRRLECKRRLDPGGARSLAGAAGGAVQGWGKWSLALDAAGAPPAEIMQPARYWRTVVKRRRMRRFAPPGTAAAETAPGEALEDGCEMELTDIETGGEAWWSLGLEAFGAALAPLDVLHSCVPSALGDAPPLDRYRSLSYPEWLLILGK